METGYSKPSLINEIILMIRKQNDTLLSQPNVALLIEYDFLAIMYYEINTLKCVLHIFFGYRVICYWSLITGNL